MAKTRIDLTSQCWFSCVSCYADITLNNSREMTISRRSLPKELCHIATLCQIEVQFTTMQHCGLVSNKKNLLVSCLLGLSFCQILLHVQVSIRTTEHLNNVIVTQTTSPSKTTDGEEYVWQYTYLSMDIPPDFYRSHYDGLWATINNFVREPNLWEQKQTKTNVMRGANLLLSFNIFNIFNIDKRYFFSILSISTNDTFVQYRQTILLFNIDKRYLELHWQIHVKYNRGYRF